MKWDSGKARDSSDHGVFCGYLKGGIQTMAYGGTIILLFFNLILQNRSAVSVLIAEDVGGDK